MANVSFADVVTDWQLDPTALVLLAAASWAYAVGVRRLAARGRRWPAGRCWLWAGAIAVGVVATQSGIGRYDTERLSVHMGQHLLLGMVVPLLVVCAAPVTLALQAGGPATKRTLRQALHAGWARVLTHPVVTWLLFGGAMVVVYFTPVLEVIARNDGVHFLVHAHFVVAGSLFLAVVLATDPVPRPMHPGLRMLVILMAVPFHAFLGLAMASATEPLAPVAYPSMSDQQAAAALLWGIGEPFTLVVAAIIARQWYVADQREAARADRRADAALPAELEVRPQAFVSTLGEGASATERRQDRGVDRSPLGGDARGRPPADPCRGFGCRSWLPSTSTDLDNRAAGHPASAPRSNPMTLAPPLTGISLSAITDAANDYFDDEISISVTALDPSDGTSVQRDEEATFTVTVENTGSVDLTNFHVHVAVADPTKAKLEVPVMGVWVPKPSLSAVPPLVFGQLVDEIFGMYFTTRLLAGQEVRSNWTMKALAVGSTEITAHVHGNLDLTQVFANGEKGTTRTVAVNIND